MLFSSIQHSESVDEWFTLTRWRHTEHGWEEYTEQCAEGPAQPRPNYCLNQLFESLFFFFKILSPI